MRFRNLSASGKNIFYSKLENKKIILFTSGSNLLSQSLEGGHNGIVLVICYISICRYDLHS